MDAKPKLSAVAPSSGGPEAAKASGDREDLRHLERVKHVIKCLSKFVQGKKIYAKNNPTLGKFADELKNAFQNYFEEEDELVLSIDQFTIRWRDQLVYENRKREESVAFLLYKDGVGELGIQKSVAFEELDRFAEIIKEEVHKTYPEEDVVTKLWKADFASISYRVLDEYLTGEFGEGKSTQTSSEPSSLGLPDHAELLPSFQDKGRVIVEPGDPMETLDAYIERLVSPSEPSPDGSDRELFLEGMLEMLFKVSSEELRLCHEELLEEKKKDGLQSFMEAIADFAFLPNSPLVTRDVSVIIDRLLDYIVGEGDPGRLRSALEQVRGLPKRHSLPEGAKTYFTNLEKKLFERDLLAALCARVEQWNKDASQTLEYLEAVGKPATEPLCAMLHRVESTRLHQAICDVLVSISGGDIADVIEKLNTEKKELAFDAVYMADRAGLKVLPELFRELFYYPDERVREEVVKFLSRKDSEEAVSMLLEALGDENKRVRMKAMAGLEGRKDPVVSKRFHELAFDRGLSRKSVDEQEMIFKGLGSVGDGETVAKIKELLGKKRIIHFGRKKDVKLLAIRALESINDPESVSILKSLSEDTNNLVKRRAMRALASLKNMELEAGTRSLGE